MAKRREMGRDAADPRMHSETTVGRGETTGRQPGHIEPHESPSSAGNEAQVAGILHGSERASGRETQSDSSSSGRWSDESDATTHQSAHAQQEHHQQGRSHEVNPESLKSPQNASGRGSAKKRSRKAA